MSGFVYLVGAGPGDPELITVRGLKLLQAAEVVVHDRLVHPHLLLEAPAGAELLDVGKAPGRPHPSQAEINRLLVARARAGRLVVRLKGGDPFVFGRGGEEAAALRAAGIPYAVVPGVSSAVAAPAAAGIPVTHRGLARSFTVVTGRTAGDEPPDWAALARLDTLVFLMGLGELAQIVGQLIAHGRSPQTPVAVVSCGTTARQRVIMGTLDSIVLAASDLPSPATIVVGPVVELCPDTLPAFAPDREPQLLQRAALTAVVEVQP